MLLWREGAETLMMPDSLFLSSIGGGFLAIVIILVIWSIAWKGIALWKAARLGHMWWFVILLIVNTAGILEILYIFLVARPREKKQKGTSPVAN